MGQCNISAVVKYPQLMKGAHQLILELCVPDVTRFKPNSCNVIMPREKTHGA